MKKTTILSLGAMACLFMSLSLAQTEEKATSDQPAVAKTDEVSKVAQQFAEKTSVAKDGKYAPAKVAPDAKYYIILSSASWCPPCRAEMPKIVKEYNEKISKNPDLELIHISADRNEADASKWAKDVKMTFPTVLPGKEKGIEVLKLSKARGIPSMMIVTSDGELITEGHPAMLLGKYEEIIKKHEAK